VKVNAASENKRVLFDEHHRKGMKTLVIDRGAKEFLYPIWPLSYHMGAAATLTAKTPDSSGGSRGETVEAIAKTVDARLCDQ
jgi:hypothetical protein